MVHGIKKLITTLEIWDRWDWHTAQAIFGFQWSTAGGNAWGRHRSKI